MVQVHISRLQSVVSMVQVGSLFMLTSDNNFGFTVSLLSLLQYYLRTGGCKFGKACRYNHTKAKPSAVPVLELNFLGLPIRLVLLMYHFENVNRFNESNFCWSKL